MIEKCLLEWGIDGVLTVKCDNASSNNLGIEWLKKKTGHWKNVVLDHKFVHVRCSAHILNLVVLDGLKTFDESIFRVRKAIKYVRSSPSRWAKWNQCVKDEKINFEKNVCMDVATRWNSTYLMLNTAVMFEKAFERLDDEDDGYSPYFDKSNEKKIDETCEVGVERVVEKEVDLVVGERDEVVIEGNTNNANKRVYHGPPTRYYWTRARMFVEILEVYYKTTLKISGSNYVTYDLLFNEIVNVKSNLNRICNSNDLTLRGMDLRMVVKFDKYWNLEKMNLILLVVVVLDPRFKLEYVGFSLQGLYNESKITLIKAKTKTTLLRLYEWYRANNSGIVSPSNNETVDNVEELDLATKWRMHNQQGNLGSMTEVDKYLTSLVEEVSVKTSKTFEILTSWKSNASKYPILSLVARDILAIPVTSVASESAFSTGGRILDSFRTSLSPNTVEALICTRNWFRTKTKSVGIEALIEETNQYDAIDAELLNVAVLSIATDDLDS